MRHRPVLALPLLALASLLAFACTQDFDIFLESGGAGLTTTGPSSGGGAGSATGNAGCQSEIDCDDHNPCTHDLCIASIKICAHDPLVGQVTGPDCTVRVCGTGSGGVSRAPAGTPCSSNNGTVCDSTGACVGCSSNSDCAAVPAATCQYGSCVSQCNDGQKDGTESDRDCGGGACRACEVGGACRVASDCVSQLCLNGMCAPTTCTNGTQDSGESGVDCGGWICAKCATGVSCYGDADCESKHCYGGTCVTAMCFDGSRDGSETDIDCGGECRPCNWGQGCNQGSDCTSRTCNQNKCG